MGVGDLRASFNSVGPKTATMALLDYRRVDNAEWQILTFRGTDENGAAFEVQSELLPPGADLNEAARKTAVVFNNGG